MSFSEKFGFKKEISLQINSMTPELRNALWNPIYLSLGLLGEGEHFNQELASDIWLHIFEWPVDEFFNPPQHVYASPRPGYHQQFLLRAQKNHFESRTKTWLFDKNTSRNKVYDLITKIAEYEEDDSQIINLFNQTLEKHNSAYRLQDGEFIRITEPVLIEAIDKVQNAFAHEVREELNKAIIKLSERGNGEKYTYNESAEAAIHMLEAYLKAKTGEATLGDAIKRLKKQKKIENILSAILEKVYAFANSQLRHAIQPKDSQIVLEYSDALYILHISLALLNYLEYPGQLFQLAEKDRLIQSNDKEDKG